MFLEFLDINENIVSIWYPAINKITRLSHNGQSQIGLSDGTSVTVKMSYSELTNLQKDGRKLFEITSLISGNLKP